MDKYPFDFLKETFVVLRIFIKNYEIVRADETLTQAVSKAYRLSSVLRPNKPLKKPPVQHTFLVITVFQHYLKILQIN